MYYFLRTEGRSGWWPTAWVELLDAAEQYQTQPWTMVGLPFSMIWLHWTRALAYARNHYQTYKNDPGTRRPG